MPHKDFLTHLAGLRGLAIIFVVLFHLNGKAWPQGYLGVDIFLVLTGYLLFRNRLQQAERTTWKQTGQFLLRRVKRIYPCMLPIIIISVALGFLLFCPEDEWSICKVGYTACLAKANTTLTKIFSNYFATDAKYNPLLHLWYLSVVLQVYLIYAIANLALQRMPKRVSIAALCTVSLLSLMLCYSYPLHEWLSKLGAPIWEQQVGVSYYSTLPRLWEVAAGGLAFALPELSSRRCCATIASALGLLLVLLPALADLSPGALLTVSGTVILLRYTPQSHLNILLSNKIFLWLGGISFSVFLVHMPLFVFWRMWLLGEVGVRDETLMVAAAVLLGWGYWWVIEKRRCPWWLLLLLWALAMIMCRVGRDTKGFKPYALPQAKLNPHIDSPARACKHASILAQWEPKLNKWSSSQLHAIPAAKRPKQPILAMGDDSAQPTVLLIGDSHASHLYEGLNAFLKEKGMGGVYLSSIIAPFSGWTVVNHDDKGEYYFNPDKEAALMRWLKNHREITHIIIGQRWHSRIRIDDGTASKAPDALRTFLQHLRATGKHVILAGPVPEFGLHFSVMRRTLVLRGRSIGDINIYRTQQEYKYANGNKDVIPLLERMESEGLCSFLDMRKTLAEGEVFSATEGEYSLMKDDNHLSIKGSIHIVKKLGPQLLKALDTPPPAPQE